jgi:hypothetical protein
MAKATLVPTRASGQFPITQQDIIKISLDNNELMAALQGLVQIQNMDKYPNYKLSQNILLLLFTSTVEEMLLFVKIYSDYLNNNGSIIIYKSFDSFSKYIKQVWQILGKSFKDNTYFTEDGDHQMILLSDFLRSCLENDLELYQQDKSFGPLSLHLFGNLPSDKLVFEFKGVIMCLGLLLDSGCKGIPHLSKWIDIVTLIINLLVY